MIVKNKTKQTLNVHGTFVWTRVYNQVRTLYLPGNDPIQSKSFFPTFLFSKACGFVRSANRGKRPRCFSRKSHRSSNTATARHRVDPKTGEIYTISLAPPFGLFGRRQHSLQNQNVLFTTDRGGPSRSWAGGVNRSVRPLPTRPPAPPATVTRATTSCSSLCGKTTTSRRATFALTTRPRVSSTRSRSFSHPRPRVGRPDMKWWTTPSSFASVKNPTARGRETTDWVSSEFLNGKVACDVTISRYLSIPRQSGRQRLARGGRKTAWSRKPDRKRH